MKFTETGGVLVERRPQPERGRLRFTVDDTGPGVSPAQRERIFEAFAQADPAHAHLGGAGLGLAIARRLALAMDGDVGRRAPRRAAARASGSRPRFRASAAAAAPAAALAGRKVGVASPNPIVRDAAAQQIAACGGAAGRSPPTSTT